MQLTLASTGNGVRGGMATIDQCFCVRVFFYPVGYVCLALFRFAAAIVTGYRLFGGGPPAQTHHGKFIGNEFIHYIHMIHATVQQSCCCLFHINRLDNHRLPKRSKTRVFLT
jgi:hypothetical protein